MNFKVFFIILLGVCIFSQRASAQTWLYADTMIIEKKDKNGVVVYKNGEIVYDSIKVVMWVPAGVTKVRGLVIANDLIAAGPFLRSSYTRDVAAKHELGIVQFQHGYLGIFDITKDHGNFLQTALDHLSEKSGIKEVAFAPWFTMGHSTQGYFARRMAWWQPLRSFGVISYKSAGFDKPTWAEPGAEEEIAHVPFLFLQGQVEDFSPNPTGTFEFYWHRVRDYAMAARAQHFLINQAVEPKGLHGTIPEGNIVLMSQFLDKAATYRIPKGVYATTRPINLVKLTERDGWLSDTIIKQLIDSRDFRRQIMAPYAYYQSPVNDIQMTYWQFDKEFGEIWVNFHHDPDRWNGGIYWVYTDVENGQTKHTNCRLYPNPAAHTLRIEPDELQAGNLDIQIFDAQGRQQFTHSLYIDNGQYAFDCNIQNLPAGIYWLVYRQGRLTSKIKFIKA